MATLVSPGVSVTVTDESYYIPASAPTVPLFFVATADEKLQIDNVSPATGTYEHDIVRTITSLRQSTQMYGIPRFVEDSNGNQMHGHSCNEYGLFALNQFLGVGNRAYVVRANVNLNDSIDNIRNMWDTKIADAAAYLQLLVDDWITSYNVLNELVGEAGSPIVGSPSAKVTIDPANLIGLVATATTDLFNSYSFTTLQALFVDDHSVAPLNVYANGYDSVKTGTYEGLTYIINNIDSYGGLYAGGTTVAGEFTPAEAAALLADAADDFKYTTEFNDETQLGTNDVERRAAIVQALQTSIVSNTELRSDNYNYNIILCPGYYEVVDEMVALTTDINEEALVIADMPMDVDPDEAVAWSLTSARQTSVHAAYYYPHVLATNLDGKNVMGAASGTALRTITYSDNVSFLWQAPAGLRRGGVTGISGLGYVGGTVGEVTTFVEANLSAGQKDALYEYNVNVNPIVFMPGRGFVVMGQKTSAPAASAMDRINVSRLIKYIKRQLRRNTLSFVFEPNDQLTRDNLKAAVDGFLGDLIVKRGLYDFVTICDLSNNTSDRIDRNEMYIDVLIKPVKAAEFIYIPIRVVSTSAEI